MNKSYMEHNGFLLILLFCYRIQRIHAGIAAHFFHPIPTPRPSGNPNNVR